MKKSFKKIISLVLAAVVLCASTINVCALSPKDEEIIRGVYDFVDKTLENNSVRGGKLKECENLAVSSKILSQKGENVTPKLVDKRRITGLLVTKGDNIYINFEKTVTSNTIVLREMLYKPGSLAFALEGGTKQFSIYASLNGKEKLIYRNDKIDSYRMCTFPEETFDSLRIQFDDCRGSARLNEIEVYNVGKTKQDFRINDYFVYEGSDYAHNEQFINYLDSVTDLTLFIGVWINEKGEVVYNKEEFEKKLNDVRTAIGSRDVKLYCNVFSNSADASFFSNNKILAKNLVDFMVEYSIDGVDIDWEYPQTLNDHKAYNQLVIDLHEEFVKYGKKLSIATAVWNMKFTPEARDAIDYFNIMVYDHVSDDYNGYHSTFKQTVLAMERLAYRGYDMSKICLGFPYYGRNLKNSPVGNYWIDYKNSGIKDPWTNYSPNGIYKNKETGEMMSGEAYFNGYAMIRDKTSYAISMGVGGIMTWSMMSDMPAESELSLHRAVNDAVEQRLAS